MKIILLDFLKILVYDVHNIKLYSTVNRFIIRNYYTIRHTLWESPIKFNSSAIN